MGLERPQWARRQKPTVPGGRRHSPRPGFVLTAGWPQSSPSPRPGDRRRGSRPEGRSSLGPAPLTDASSTFRGPLPAPSLQGIFCQAGLCVQHPRSGLVLDAWGHLGSAMVPPGSSQDGFDSSILCLCLEGQKCLSDVVSRLFIQNMWSVCCQGAQKLERPVPFC